MTAKRSRAELRRYMDESFRLLKEQEAAAKPALPAAPKTPTRGDVARRLEDATLAISTPEERGTTLARRASAAPAGVDLKTRFLAQLTSDPDARLKFLQQEFGAENVGLDEEGGRTLVRQDGKIKVLDPQGFSLKDLPADLADIAGEVAEGLAGIAGAAGGAFLGAAGGPPGIAAGAITGEVTGASSARAGIESLFRLGTGIESDVGGEALEAGLLSLGGSVATRSAGAALKGAMRAARIGPKGMATTFSRQAAKADQVLKDLAGVSDAGSITAAANAAKKGADGLRSAVKGLERSRTDLAGHAIKTAIREAGDAPAVPINGTLRAIDDIVEQYAKTPIGDAPEAIVKALSKQRDQLLRASTLVGDEYVMPLASVQAALSETSAALGGRSALVRKIKNTGTDRRLAGKLQDALLDDLEGAVTTGTLAESAQRDLLDGRRLYALMSNKIRQTEQGAIKRILKLSDEQEFEAIPKLLTSSGKPGPARVREMSAFLSDYDPEALSALQFSALDDLFTRSTRAGELDPVAFSSAAQRAGRKLEALFEGTPKAAAQMKVLRALGDKAKAGASGPLAKFPLSVVVTASDLLESLGITRGAEAVKSAISTVTGRTALIKLMQKKAPTPEAAKEFADAVYRQGLLTAANAKIEEPRSE